MERLTDFFKEFWEGLSSAFTQSELRTSSVILTLAIAVLLSVYIFFIYRVSNRTGFYSKNFNKTVAGMGVITAAIVLSMQTSVFISLGMVGALSIVRFRNVIKDPYDLLFLFWSISTGIIVGTGLYKIAFLLAATVTILIFLLELSTMPRAPYLLVINSDDKTIEQTLLPLVKKYSRSLRVKSRNISVRGVDLIIEVRTNKESELIQACSELTSVTNAALLSHDGELRG